MRFDAVRKVTGGDVPLPMIGAGAAAIIGAVGGLGMLLDGVSGGLVAKALVAVGAVFVVMCRLGGGLAAVASLWGMAKAWKVWAPVLGPLMFIAAVPRSWFVAAVVFAVAMLFGVAGGYVWSLRPQLAPLGVPARGPVVEVADAAEAGGDGWWVQLQGRARGHWKAKEIRKGWARACAEMGFDAGRKNADGSTGPRQVPELLKGERGVRVTPDSYEISFIPRGDMDPVAWAKLTSRMEGYYGCHSSSYEVFVPRRPNTRCIRVLLGRRPMRKLVTGVPVEPSGGRGWIIGERAGGGYLRLRLGDARPHALIVGGTGGGKTNILRGLCMQAHADGWRVFVIDPKGTAALNDFMDLLADGVVDRVVHDVADGAALITTMEANRNNLATGVHADDQPRILFVIDEVRDIIGERGRQDPLRDIRRAAGAALTDLAQKGRSAGVHLVMAIQRADVAELGASGGYLRAQLGATVSTGDLDDDGYDMAFSGVTASDRILMTGEPGRGMVQKIDAGMGGDAVPVQCVLWPAPPIDEDIRARMRAMREKDPEATYADLMNAGKVTPPTRAQAPTPERRSLQLVQSPPPIDEPTAETVEADGPLNSSGAAGPVRPSRFESTRDDEVTMAAAVALHGVTRTPFTRSDLAAYLERPPRDGTVGRSIKALVKAGRLEVVATTGRSTLYAPASVRAPDPVSHGR